jgi:hypothetical protein
MYVHAKSCHSTQSSLHKLEVHFTDTWMHGSGIQCSPPLPLFMVTFQLPEPQAVHKLPRVAKPSSAHLIYVQAVAPIGGVDRQADAEAADTQATLHSLLLLLPLAALLSAELHTRELQPWLHHRRHQSSRVLPQAWLLALVSRLVLRHLLHPPAAWVAVWEFHLHPHLEGQNVGKGRSLS